MKTLFIRATKNEVVDTYVAKREYHSGRKSVVHTAEELGITHREVCEAIGFDYDNWVKLDG
jgi:hypothetical protein